MDDTFEYKLQTLEQANGVFAHTPTPADDESSAALNRKRPLELELANATCSGISQPPAVFFKRPR